MAKKKEEAPPPGSPAWMATFSDLMNLLLCFFVLLFSMSTIDEAKLNEIIASMSSSFSVFQGGATAIGDGILVSNGVSQLNELSEYINSTGKVAESESEAVEFEEYDNEQKGVEEMREELEDVNLAKNEEIKEAIDEALAESAMADQVDVSFTAQYVMLTMKGALLFASGSADLREAAYPVLDKVGGILERYAQGEIEIDGHTDNIPIHSSQFPSNEELSSARALSVFYYMAEHTRLNIRNMKHSGMGERVPVADNATDAGRAQNRRVEIRIYNAN